MLPAAAIALFGLCGIAGEDYNLITEINDASSVRQLALNASFFTVAVPKRPLSPPEKYFCKKSLTRAGGGCIIVYGTYVPDRQTRRQNTFLFENAAFREKHSGAEEYEKQRS